MNSVPSDEKQWIEWFAVQRKAVALSLENKLSAAVSEVNAFIQNDLINDVLRNAIGFRGDLWEELGDLEAAKSDFMAAHRLSEQCDFERYTLELSLGGIATRLRLRGDAILWYFRALETAAGDPTISGATALGKFLRVRMAEPFSEIEMRLISKVILQAWTLFGIEGDPDLTDLEAVVEILKREQRKSKRDRPTS
ncbi:MAG: hypothetical protein HC897_13315 [Thermoanaerobaculia bacterium]|nr:hypothetical protein [Thermoanaerobaculia bacterium]